MLGVRIDSGGEFIEKIVGLFSNIATTNLWSVLIAVVGVGILIGGRRLLPVVPWALVVLVLATVVVVLTPRGGGRRRRARRGPRPDPPS